MNCPTSPKCIAKLLLRVSFGAALLLVGVTHLQNLDGFKGMVSGDLGRLAPLGTLWAYIYPLLMIVGGGLIVAGKKSDAEMIALIKEHREAAGGTAGKTLKVLRDMGISCSQERFKKLYASAS